MAYRIAHNWEVKTDRSCFRENLLQSIRKVYKYFICGSSFILKSKLMKKKNLNKQTHSKI